MNKNKLRERLNAAGSLEEVKSIAAKVPGLDAERAWEEIQRHRSEEANKLDLNELDAVSGGFDRDWLSDGCAATCEISSWCGSNDWCQVWDVTYDHFGDVCPDGHRHIFQDNVCIRCGQDYPSPTEWWEDI